MTERSTDTEHDGPEISKREIRALAIALRRDLVDKDQRSRAICKRFCALPEFAAATTVFLYVHVRDEVRTAELLARLLQSDKQVVVPYCTVGALELFQLRAMEDLAEGYFGLQEPRQSLRDDPTRRVPPDAIDLLAVPGLAFDRSGGRLGHGRAYFDRFLPRLRPDATAVGMAFECQIFPRVPMEAHDVFLDKIITEQAVYRGCGRSGDQYT